MSTSNFTCVLESLTGVGRFQTEPPGVGVSAKTRGQKISSAKKLQVVQNRARKLCLIIFINKLSPMVKFLKNCVDDSISFSSVFQFFRQLGKCLIPVAFALQLMMRPAFCEETADSATVLAKGNEAWAHRSDGFEYFGIPNETNARLAVSYYRQASRLDNQDIEVLFKHLEANYFVGEFVAKSLAERKEIYQESVELCAQIAQLIAKKGGVSLSAVEFPRTEQAVKLGTVPYAAKYYFWSAISWGLWGMTHSYFDCVRKGVAGRIRDDAQMVIELDEKYADGGGFRLLGRMHSITPRIPFFTGWIDRSKGIELLRKANEISILDPRNQLFLAQALYADDPQNNKKEVLSLLENLLQRQPQPDYVVEQTQIYKEAREFLREVTNKDLRNG